MGETDNLKEGSENGGRLSVYQSGSLMFTTLPSITLLGPLNGFGLT